MATLIHDKHGNCLVAFRWGGKQFTRSLETKDPAVAKAGVARVEETIMRLRRGYSTLPDDAEPGSFIVSGGKHPTKPVPESTTLHNTPAPAPLTLSGMFDLYNAQMPAGKKELNTLLTERIHRNHLVRILGSESPVETMTLAEAQKYASRRSVEEWRGRPIGSDTIRKELKTLRYVWGWAVGLDHLAAACKWNLKDVDLGKDQGREPFRTMEEIERRIARGGLSEKDKDRYWECLFLTSEEIRDCLAYVENNAAAPSIYPMFVFCALTGARRSELCRSRIEDFDFENRVVHIRERKRDRTKRETIRNVEMHDLIGTVMRSWFDRHPGGQFTLAQEGGSPVSIDLASAQFERTLAGHKKWGNIKGFHTFRHSFASVLAMKGVDQRVIDGLMGHQTEEMRKRYRHLFPISRKRAIDELLPQGE
jgi:integrase